MCSAQWSAPGHSGSGRGQGAHARAPPISEQPSGDCPERTHRITVNARKGAVPNSFTRENALKLLMDTVEQNKTKTEIELHKKCLREKKEKNFSEGTHNYLRQSKINNKNCYEIPNECDQVQYQNKLSVEYTSIKGNQVEGRINFTRTNICMTNIPAA